MLLQSHIYKVAYKYKEITLGNHYATLLEVNEDHRAQVLCADFYLTAVSSELHNFELFARYVVFLYNPYRRTLQQSNLEIAKVWTITLHS